MAPLRTRKRLRTSPVLASVLFREESQGIFSPPPPPRRIITPLIPIRRISPDHHLVHRAKYPNRNPLQTWTGLSDHFLSPNLEYLMRILGSHKQPSPETSELLHHPADSGHWTRPNSRHTTQCRLSLAAQVSLLLPDSNPPILPS